jgi:hypothetical protein
MPAEPQARIPKLEHFGIFHPPALFRGQVHPTARSKRLPQPKFNEIALCSKTFSRPGFPNRESLRVAPAPRYSAARFTPQQEANAFFARAATNCLCSSFLKYPHASRIGTTSFPAARFTPQQEAKAFPDRSSTKLDLCSKTFGRPGFPNRESLRIALPRAIPPARFTPQQEANAFRRSDSIKSDPSPARKCSANSVLGRIVSVTL